MKIVYSKKYLEHDTGAFHPEKSKRLEAIKEYLELVNAPIVWEDPRNHDVDFLHNLHSKEYVEKVKLHSRMGVGTADNPFHANTFDVAKHAAEGALKAAELAEDEFAFALIRPPGHHAGKDYFTGFCYFNNIGLAIKKFQKSRRVLIIDIDVHHCNGTQDLFYGDDSVFTLSIHQDPASFYPFVSGYEHENNPGAMNIPLPPGTLDEDYLKKFEKAVKQIKKTFEPEMIAVSVGFDTWHKDSQLIGNRVRFTDHETYNKLGRIIAGFDVPTFAVLEGGYYLPDLGKNAWEFIRAFENKRQ